MDKDAGLKKNGEIKAQREYKERLLEANRGVIAY